MNAYTASQNHGLHADDPRVVNSESSVSLGGLLSLYALVPALVILVWVDNAVLDHAILLAVPFQPEVWAVWIYIFGMPHVVASMHTLLDREYLEVYKGRVVRLAAFFVLLPIVVTQLVGPMATFGIYAAYLVYHTVSQQFGIAVAAMRQKPGLVFVVWKWSAVLLGAIVFGMIYVGDVPLALQPHNDLRQSLTQVLGILLAANLGAGLALLWIARRSRIGVAHVIANTAMIATEYFLFLEGYYAFAIILGRVIHEFTAWHIYATHDRNRSLAGAPNMLFRMLRFTRIPIYPLSILAAFAVGIAITYGALSFAVTAPLLLSLSLMHFHMEGFIWKNGSIHRRSLSFS